MNPKALNALHLYEIDMHSVKQTQYVKFILRTLGKLVILTSHEFLTQLLISFTFDLSVARPFTQPPRVSMYEDQ